MDFADFLSSESIFKHSRKLSLHSTWFQLFSTFTATLSILSCGFHFGWPSPSLPKLFEIDSPVHINKNQGSWLAVAPLIGGLIGSITISYVVDKLGRKLIILSTMPLYFTSWVLISLADNYWMIFIGRVIAGLGDGGGYVAIPMYVGEIADERIRGILGSLITIMLLLGQLIINIIGSFVPVKTMALFALIVPTSQFIAYFFIPESPYFLLMKGESEKARESLKRLRNSDLVDKELTKIHASIKRQMENSGNILDLFSDRHNRKAILITIGLRTIQQLSGISFFTFYAQYIFGKAGDDISPVLSSIIFNGLLLFLCFVSSLMLDKVGRKPLLISSIIGCGFTLFVNGVYFWNDQHNSIPYFNQYWISLASMLAYILVYSLGLGIIPICMLSELFPANIKGKALAFMELYFSLIVAVTTKLFQFLDDTYGLHAPFFLCTFCCVFGIIFAFTCVPETKGKTLEEIQLNLRGETRKRRTVLSDQKPIAVNGENESMLKETKVTTIQIERKTSVPKTINLTETQSK